MQSFTCPNCGHQSTYDPWVESAHCPQCGYTPPEDLRIRPGLSKRARTYRPFLHQSLLEELLSHWKGTYTPDSSFMLPTSELRLGFFHAYQRALGEAPDLGPGDHGRYIRSYHPQQDEILLFVGAFMLLKRGDAATAARLLRRLTMQTPEFTDPWVWLTATTSDPAERIGYLERAVVQEPTHPLARDALAIARGRVSLGDRLKGEGMAPEARIVRCPQCGGSWHYDPGAPKVVCAYCGYELVLPEINLLEREARLISDLRLERRYEGRVWAEVTRVASCRSCGAELTMTRHLAKQCPFCGSTSVLAGDSGRTFQQPDGFLPFTIDEQDARSAIHKAQRSGLRGLTTWLRGKEPKLVEIQGLYLPFWVFDGFVEVRTRKTGASGEFGGRGGRTPTSDMMMFDNLLVPGVDVPPRWFLRRIFPFELSALVPYDPRLLADWPAALYHLDVEGVVEDAYELMMSLARGRVAVLGEIEQSEDTDTDVGRPWRVTSATYQLLLLPVWVAIVQYGAQRRSALVNGQTGKVAFGPLLSSLRSAAV